MAGVWLLWRIEPLQSVALNSGAAALIERLTGLLFMEVVQRHLVTERACERSNGGAEWAPEGRR